MNRSNLALMTIEAELRAEVARAQIIRFDFPEPLDHIRTQSDSIWVDMCLTPRPANARACYLRRWERHRFEPIGEILVVPPGEAMHVKCNRGRQTSIVCEINPQLLTKWFEGDLDWNGWLLEGGLHVSDRSIYALLMRLAREVGRPGFASEMLLELLVSQLAIELGRYCVALADAAPKSGLAAWRLRLIDERVRAIGKAPTLSELAELCNLSVRQLSRGFRISRACSIGDYVEQACIENAKRLLVSGKSVKAVAYSLGFASPSSFSFAFRRATGITPAEYRKLA